MKLPEENKFESKDDIFKVKRLINQLVANWYLILGFLSLALSIAFLIIRYEAPVYSVTSSFLTKKFDESAEASSLMQLSEGGNILQNRIEIFQEIPLLKSQDRIGETLNRLNFDVSYFVEGRFKTSQVYESDFYQVRYDRSDKVPFNTRFYLSTADFKTYQLEVNNQEWNQYFTGKDFSFGKPYKINNSFTLHIDLLETNGADPDYQHYFVFNNLAQLETEYRSNLILRWQRTASSLLEAEIESDLPEKDLDFLETYLEVIVEKGLEEKNEALTNTVNFINDYLPQISDTLLSYQKRLDVFKLENREIINGSTFLFGKIDQLEQEKAELLISNQYFDYIVKYIRENRGEEVFAPALIGLNDPPLNMLVQQYTNIKWQEEEGDKNRFNEKNPLIGRAKDELSKIENNIVESVRSLKEANNRKIYEIDKEVNFFSNSVADFQVESREYAELQRLVTLYEGVIDNLITRRTEVFLSQASTVSDYQIVSKPAYNKTKPISPNKQDIYIIAVLFGLGIPLGYMYLKDFFNNKVISKKDLTNNTNIPLLGNVGHSTGKDNLAVFSQPKSLVAESFRGIRANLMYFEKNKDDNTVLITSSVSGEGKTFCSINLSITYALARKKTILVGADLRKPALARSFDMSNNNGLSDYLAGLCTMDEAIHQTDNEFLHVIPGGSIPPNPGELILSDRMDELMKVLKKDYDLIVIDTPPIGLVADAMELMKFSTTNLLIVRQRISRKKSLEHTTEMYNKGQIKDLAVLFNDVDFRKLEYGYTSYTYDYGYGYGYGAYTEERRSKGVFRNLFGKR